jgi:hypothetical protein
VGPPFGRSAIREFGSAAQDGGLVNRDGQLADPVTSLRSAKFGRRFRSQPLWRKSMYVSNFTLGYNYSFLPEVDQWVKAYELQITNLAAVPITFGIETRITYSDIGGSHGGESVAKMLNQFLQWDFSRDDDGYYSYYEHEIDANGSFTYNLSPGIDQRNWTPYVDGYTILRVPVVPGSKPSSPKVPQSTKPIPVLLRAGGLQQWYRAQEPGSSLVASSESNPQLGTGTAYNEIPPDTSPIYRPFGFKQYLRGIAEVTKLADISAGAPGGKDVAAKPVVSQGQRLLQRPAQAVAPAEDSRAATLIELLSSVATDKAEIDTLNEILRDRGVGISVKRDKG